MPFNKAAIPSEHPMYIFRSSIGTDGEVTIKEEVEAYLISEVDHTERIRVKGRVIDVQGSADLPDAVCDGLTFKQRVVRCGQQCFLLARWKPDRYMRRAASGTSQKWFLDKELFPSDIPHFLSDLSSAG